MNKEAYQLLQRLRLPSVRRMRVLDAATTADGGRVYLRYTGEARHRARPVTHVELRERMEELQRDEDSGVLAGVEPDYAIDLGGALFLHEEVRYAECVAGHPEALLRRGLCGSRFVWGYHFDEARPKRRVITTLQGWSLERREDGLRWQRLLKLARADQFWVTEKIASLSLPSPDIPLLLEWFRANNELTFCDARYVPELAAWRETVTWVLGMREALAQFLDSQARSVQIDWFDVDAFSPQADVLIARDGALLSHFVTRHFGSFNKLIVVLTGRQIGKPRFDRCTGEPFLVRPQ